MSKTSRDDAGDKPAHLKMELGFDGVLPAGWTEDDLKQRLFDAVAAEWNSIIHQGGDDRYFRNHVRTTCVKFAVHEEYAPSAHALEFGRAVLTVLWSKDVDVQYFSVDVQPDHDVRFMHVSVSVERAVLDALARGDASPDVSTVWTDVRQAIANCDGEDGQPWRIVAITWDDERGDDA